MPKGVPAPYYVGQIRPLVGRRENLRATITPTRHRIFFEIRKPLSLEVPDVKKTTKGLVVTFLHWTANPGQVLMPYWAPVSTEEQELIGPIMGFRGSRLKRVMLIEDVESAARQQIHILEGYLGKRRRVRGRLITRLGEIDRLTELVASLSQTDPASDYFTELLEKAEQTLARARDLRKKRLAAALHRQDLDAGRRHLDRRLENIFDVIGGILVRQREAKRIIDKIRRGFDTAYIRMDAAIKELETKSLSTAELTLLGDRIHEKIYRYLADKVAAFEPYYSVGHDPAVVDLANSPKLIAAGKIRIVANKLEAAMDAIEKVVSGTVPTAATIKSLRARAARHNEHQKRS